MTNIWNKVQRLRARTQDMGRSIIRWENLMTLQQRQPEMFAYVYPWRLFKHVAPEWFTRLCGGYKRTTHRQC